MSGLIVWYLQAAVRAAAAARRWTLAKDLLAKHRPIPYGGVMVRATDVRRHRYLREHGLPFSSSMAAVHIGIGK